MDDRKKSALHGGCQTAGIVLIGDTVRRPLHERSAYVHAVLNHLASVGFDGAPRLRGIDERGLEVLGYIPGEVIARSPAHLADARLVSAGRLVRAFHDATAGTPLAAGREVVCHGDLGSHNIVFDGDEAVAIIDWDENVGPGTRLVDFAHAVWCCADVCEVEVDVLTQARKVRLMCDAYGCQNPVAVLDEIASRFCRARDGHAAAGRTKAASIFEEMMRWMEQHGPALKAAL